MHTVAPAAIHLPAGVMPEREANREEPLTTPPEAKSRSGGGFLSSQRTVTVLCAARSTVYRAFPGLAIFSRSANAWNARPRGPVIAHPPCRCWSRLRGLTNLTVKERIEEMLLAFHCLRLVISCGGVLEQPAFSALWSAACLPRPGDLSAAPALWSITIDQSNFGHITTKPTWLLLAGIDPTALLFDSWQLADASPVKLAALTPGQRSATPIDFAAFLIGAARCAKPPGPAERMPWDPPHHPVTPDPAEPPISQPRPRRRE